MLVALKAIAMAVQFGFAMALSQLVWLILADPAPTGLGLTQVLSQYTSPVFVPVAWAVVTGLFAILGAIAVYAVHFRPDEDEKYVAVQVTA